MSHHDTFSKLIGVMLIIRYAALRKQGERAALMPGINAVDEFGLEIDTNILKSGF